MIIKKVNSDTIIDDTIPMGAFIWSADAYSGKALIKRDFSVLDIQIPTFKAIVDRIEIMDLAELKSYGFNATLFVNGLITESHKRNLEIIDDINTKFKDLPASELDMKLNIARTKNKYFKVKSNLVAFETVLKNLIPVANRDVTDIYINEPTLIDVVANDTDDKNITNIINVRVVNGSGSVSIVNNKIQYTPDSSFDLLEYGLIETVTIAYTIKDDTSKTSEGELVITLYGSLILDHIPPTASITISDETLKVGETATVTIVFSEAVTNFGLNDLTYTNGTLTNLTSTDSIYWTALFTPSNNILDTTNIIRLSGTYEDLYRNVGAIATSNNYIVDTTIPSAMITMNSYNLVDTVPTLVTITFSEPVYGFSNASLNVENGTLSTLTTTDNILWTATFTPTRNIVDTTNTITLIEGSYIDIGGNIGSGAVSANYQVSDYQPIATIAINKTALKFGETATVTITFSEAVSNFTTANLIVYNGVITVLTTTNNIVFTGTYIPNVDTETTGSVYIASFEDLSGNPGTPISSSNIAIDTRKPIPSITFGSTTLIKGQTTSITIYFSEKVLNFSNADVTVQNGTLSTLTTPDLGITWVGTFTPTANLQDTTNIISIGTAYNDVVGNAAIATSSGNYIIDTKVPTVTFALSDAALVRGDACIVTMTFSEVVPSLSISSLTAANATLSNLYTTNGGTIWKVTLSPNMNILDTTNILTLSASFYDLYGNVGGVTNSGNYTIDTTYVSSYYKPAGTAAEPTVTYNGVSGLSGGDINTLKDKNIVDDYAYVYWYYGGSIDITVSTPFRIWAMPSTPYLQYDASLIFTNFDTGIKAINMVGKDNRLSLSSKDWVISSGTIPAGRWNITTNNDATYAGRIDLEWYIETMDISTLPVAPTDTYSSTRTIISKYGNLYEKTGTTFNSCYAISPGINSDTGMGSSSGYVCLPTPIQPTSSQLYSFVMNFKITNGWSYSHITGAEAGYPSIYIGGSGYLYFSIGGCNVNLDLNQYLGGLTNWFQLGIHRSSTAFYFTVNGTTIYTQTTKEVFSLKYLLNYSGGYLTQGYIGTVRYLANAVYTQTQLYEMGLLDLGFNNAPLTYVAFNKLDKGNTVNLSNSYLTAEFTYHSISTVSANTKKSTGKWYWEIKIDSLTNGGSYPNIGVMNQTSSAASTYYYAVEGYFRLRDYGVVQGDVYGLALDLQSTTKTIKLYRNNVLVATQNLTAGITWKPTVGDDNIAGAPYTIVTAKFTGFTYTPPTGFVALTL